MMTRTKSFLLTCTLISFSAFSAFGQDGILDETIEVITEDSVTDETISTDITTSIRPEKDWRDSVGILAVGYLIQGDKDRQRRQMEIFRRTLERALKLRVLFRPAKTLDDLISMQINRRVQYAIHSASSFATAQVACKCLTPLAAPTDYAGARGVHAVLLAPANGSISSLNDLGGKRLALPQPPATITRALPLRAFENAGLKTPQERGEVINVRNPVDGWQKIQAGEADAVIGWSSLEGDKTQGFTSGTLHHLIAVTEIATSDDIKIAWQSPMIAYGPHAIRADLPTELKEGLRTFLLSLKSDNPFVYDSISNDLSGGFVTVEEADYAPLIELIKPRS